MNYSGDLAFATAISTQADVRGAFAEVAAAAQQLPAPADLAMLYFSGHHLPHAEALARLARQSLHVPCLLGCGSEGIVGGAREVEREPALALWLACLPRASVTAMHLTYQTTAEGGSFAGWPDTLPAHWPESAVLIVLGDSFSFPADVLLDRLNEDQPGVPVIGGMASAARRPGQNRLLCQGEVYDHGAVALLLHGPFRYRAIVSQGCRPVGNHFIVTRSEGNVIYELGGRPAYQRLVEVFQSLATREQAMLRQGLHLGRVVNEYQERFEQGDFLVRNVMGVEQESGAIAIGDRVRTGQTVQFHIRDAETSDGELQQLLAAAKAQLSSQPSAALLFTCNGRGTRMFAQPNHDAATIQRILGPIPLAGFFAAGELGPIGGRNFLHGFTASIGLFEPL